MDVNNFTASLKDESFEKLQKTKLYIVEIKKQSWIHQR